MLVDRVLVEEVADDAVGDGLERRKHPAEQAAVVHLGQSRVESGGRPEKLEQRGPMRRRREEIFYAESLGVLPDQPSVESDTGQSLSMAA